MLECAPRCCCNPTFRPHASPLLNCSFGRTVSAAAQAAAELAMDDASVLAAAAAGAPSEPLPPALLALLVDVRVAMASGSAQ
eukprot:44262-Chlamydomonas_euryale.AAC.4